MQFLPVYRSMDSRYASVFIGRSGVCVLGGDWEGNEWNGW